MHTHNTWPRWCNKSYWESQTHNALVKAPRYCHYFQLQVEGKEQNEGKYGNITHGL